MYFSYDLQSVEDEVFKFPLRKFSCGDGGLDALEIIHERGKSYHFDSQTTSGLPKSEFLRQKPKVSYLPQCAQHKSNELRKNMEKNFIA